MKMYSGVYKLSRCEGKDWEGARGWTAAGSGVAMESGGSWRGSGRSFRMQIFFRFKVIVKLDSGERPIWKMMCTLASFMAPRWLRLQAKVMKKTVRVRTGNDFKMIWLRSKEGNEGNAHLVCVSESFQSWWCSLWAGRWLSCWSIPPQSSKEPFWKINRLITFWMINWNEKRLPDLIVYRILGETFPNEM